MFASILVAFSILGQTQTSTGSDKPESPKDPSGFVEMLNAARAQRGLRPVVHSPQAAAVAAQNNAMQARSGLGHFVTGGFGQCAAVGMSDPASALAAWTGSPAHAALIYAPDLIAVGFDGRSGCATVATHQGFAGPMPSGSGQVQATPQMNQTNPGYGPYYGYQPCGPGYCRRGLFGFFRRR